MNHPAWSPDPTSDWLAVKETLADALDLEPERRHAFLRERCGDRPELFSAVERLLRGHDSASGFLDGPPPPTSADSPQTPDRIGPYRLHEPLGEGGFGVVHRATQVHPFEREVAIKILKAGAGAGRIVERFRAERDALARMDHEDICRVLDAGLTDDGRPFVVMELVRGSPITRFANDERIGLSERLTLLRRAARAVHHAHQRAVIHCDVKPSNILVARDGGDTRVRLIDFGIARALDGSVESRTRSDLAGTPRYMSPERREALRVPDVRADIYSLGAVLEELIADAASKRPAPPRRLLRDASAIAAKARAPQPADRYESAAELAEDLDRALADRPLRAAPERPARVLLRAIRRHRLSSLLAATALLAIAAGTTAAMVARATALDARDAATREARRAALVRDFLLDDMLGSLNPDVAQGRDITVVELLDRARERMQASLADDPLLLAEVAATLGRAFAHVGRDAKAIAAYELALAKRDEARAGEALTFTDHEQILSWQVDLAAAMMGTVERHGEGMALRGWNAFNAKKHLGEWHPIAMQARMVHVPDPLDVEVREADLRGILARARELGAEGASLAEDAARSLATLRSATGWHEEAIALLLEALESAERRTGPQHSDAIVIRRALADAYLNAGDAERANEQFDETIARTRRMLPPDHPSLTGLLMSVSLRKIEMGRAAEAHELLTEVEATVRGAAGEDSVQHVTARLSLARACVELGRYGDAAAILERVLPLIEAQWGPVHVQTARAQLVMARAQRGLGSLTEAAQLAGGVVERIGLARETGVAAAILWCESLLASGDTDEVDRIARSLLDRLPADAPEATRSRLAEFVRAK
jgi:eukaryotic-like serine/threonine-protein kinase